MGPSPGEAALDAGAEAVNSALPSGCIAALEKGPRRLC